MLDSLKRFVIKYPFLVQFMFRFYRAKNGLAATRESELRKNLSLFDIEKLSADIVFSPEEKVIDNNLYGHANAFKRYSGYPKSLPAYIEHGLFLGSMIHKDQYHWYTKGMITYSEVRQKAIDNKNLNKKVICVGPYIHYAEPIYSPEKMGELKKEFGRVLLVFPSHSVSNVQSTFDADPFIQEINRIKKDYDTVLISLYFIDAQNTEKVKLYQSHGFKTVTSGHKFDHHFIDRQKTIISLADMTMSNDMGTHIGYCIYLQKPHYIFKQPIKLVGTNEKELARINSVYSTDEKVLLEAAKEEITTPFLTYLPNEITPEQWATVDKFWGINSIKTPKELSKALLAI